MLFIAVVLAWLAMQFWGGAALFQRDEILMQWHAWLDNEYRNRVGDTGVIIALLLLPVIATALVLYIFGGWFFGLVGLVINVVVLLYACGRGDYLAQMQAYRFSMTHLDKQAVFDAADQYYSVKGDDLASVHNQVRQKISYQAYDRWFAVAFWFLILGAPGALLYRICHIVSAASSDAEEAFSSEASENFASDPADDLTGDSAASYRYCSSYANDTNTILGFMDWLPARLWALIIGLCGDFKSVVQVLSVKLFTNTAVVALLDSVNLAIVYGDRVASLNDDDTIDCHDISEAKNELDMIEQVDSRAMIVAMAVIAVLILLL